MKVIFLDIDGVMTTSNAPLSPYYNGLAFHQEAVHLLKDVLKEVGAVIVLSSNWRVFKSVSIIKETYLKPYGLDSFLYDKLSDVEKESRGEEIEDWLKEHPEVQSFIVLDDRSDIMPFESYWVRTDERVGFTKEDAQKAKLLLRKP